MTDYDNTPAVDTEGRTWLVGQSFSNPDDRLGTVMLVVNGDINSPVHFYTGESAKLGEHLMVSSTGKCDDDKSDRAQTWKEQPQWAARDALVAEAFLALLEGDDREYNRRLRCLEADSNALDLLTAAGHVFRSTAISTQGRTLAVRRLRQDISFFRELAIKEMDD